MSEQEPTILFNLKCPSCGAPLKIHGGHIQEDYITCEYCGSEYSLHSCSIDKREIQPDTVKQEDLTPFTSDTTSYSYSRNWLSAIVFILISIPIFVVLFPIALKQIQTQVPLTSSTTWNSSILNIYEILFPLCFIVVCVIYGSRTIFES